VRVLLDENLPFDLVPELGGHEVDTVVRHGWAGVKNSELMRRVGGQFDAFVTMDRNIEFQQNIPALPFGIVLVRAASNRMVHLRPLVPAILRTLEGLQKGELRRVNP
jgi:hypothetical protein